MNLYILRSRSSRRYYVGATNDLITRLAQHYSPETNPSRWTRSRGPWEMVVHKEYASDHSALLAERFVKRMKSARFIEELISGEYVLPSFEEKASGFQSRNFGGVLGGSLSLTETI